MSKPRGTWLRRSAPLIGLVALLILARALLPLWVRDYVDRTLDSVEGYEGDVRDVDLHIWRGAYDLEKVSIVKTDGDVPVPFFSSPEVVLSIEWRQVLHGALVGEVVMTRPILNFVDGPTPAQRLSIEEHDWTDRVQELFPARINRLEVRDGQIHFRNFSSSPQVDLYLSSVRGVVSNITNSLELSKTLVATAEGTAKAMGGAPLRFAAAFDPYSVLPTFDVDLELESVQLPELNDFLRAYFNVDAEGGRFDLYTEMAARDGDFEGYAKPFFENVQIFTWKKETEKNPFRLAWEAIVEGVSELLENNEDEVATRIPIRGTVEDPDTGLLATIGGLLRNAFIDALKQGLERSISLQRRAPEKRPEHS